VTAPVPYSAPPNNTREQLINQIYEPSNNGFCTMTVYIDLTTNQTVGWHLVNTCPYNVEAYFVAGQFDASQTFPPGTDVQGTIPKRLQWDFDNAPDMSYGLTPRR
jgi:hypothetical protein